MEGNVFYASMEEMVKKFLLVIPNIAAAIAILVIGNIIARILKAVGKNMGSGLRYLGIFVKMQPWHVSQGSIIPPHYTMSSYVETEVKKSS